MGILDLANYVQQQGALGKEAGQKSRLAKLYSQALAAPEDQRDSFLPQMAAESPDAANAASGQFSTMRKQAYDDLGREAGMFVALAQSGDAATAQAAYTRLAQKAQAAGHPVPPTYDPKMLPMIEKLAGVAGSVASGVQSTYIDDKGQRIAVMRDGSVQVLGANAPNNQILGIANAQGGKDYVGVNKGTLQAAPVSMGGAPQGVQMDSQPYVIDDPQNMPPQVVAAIQRQEGGQQLQAAPPPPKPVNPIEMQRLALAQAASARDAQRLAMQQQAAARTASPKPADDVKAQKLAAARADALDSVTQAITGIDSLTKSEGFSNLGTFTGDALSLIPHTKTKDASNALETVKNQVLLTTLGKLKALSATGASGFGALSNKEGAILQNSIANLEKSQSHAAILQNLKIIRGTLQRAAGLIGGNAPQAPQTDHVDDLLSKYGVK